MKIALLQILPTGSLNGNREKGVEACRKAKVLGADIALFPEMWSNGYDIPEDAEALQRAAVPAAHPLVLRGGKRHLFARRVLLPAPGLHDRDHGVSDAGGERGEERHGRRGGDPGRKRSDGVRRRMAIIVNLDMMLAKRKMTSLELANRVGMTPANLSILKTGKAKAVRMSTMDAICRELQCQPGDLFEFVQDDDPWKR